MANLEGNIHLSSRMRLSVFYEKFGTDIFHMKMPLLHNEDFWCGSLGFRKYYHCNVWLGNMEERGYVLREKKGYYSLTPLGLTMCHGNNSKDGPDLEKLTLPEKLALAKDQLKKVVVQELKLKEKLAELESEINQIESLICSSEEL